MELILAKPSWSGSGSADIVVQDGYPGKGHLFFRDDLRSRAASLGYSVTAVRASRLRVEFDAGRSTRRPIVRYRTRRRAVA
jgi:hypothetical protein